MNFYIVAIFFMFLFVSSPISAQITVKVDEKVELATIVARLAGFEEFIHNDIKGYADDVDAHFGKFRDHEMIRFAKELRQKNGIAYSQYLALPVHINPDFSPKVSFTETIPQKDFGKENAEKFAMLMKDFCRDADCAAFFKKHSSMFRETQERYQKIVDMVDQPWLEKFFGEKPEGSYNVYISLLVGGGNFGESVIYPNGKKDIFAIMGAMGVDEKGIPRFSTEGELPVLIHEFSHSFVNHIVDENPQPFAVSCEKIYKAVAEKMRAQAYGGWKTPLNESLVRVSVIRYILEHNGVEEAQSDVDDERSLGFVWMDELFALLGTYENDRKTYPTLRSYLPIIAAYHQDLSKRVDSKIARYEQLRPAINGIVEFTNGSTDVSSATTQITLTFSRPMKAKRGLSMDYGSLGEAGFPTLRKGTAYSDDGLKFSIPVTLKPNTKYEFKVFGTSFMSRDGFAAKDMVLSFTTSK